MKLVLVPAIAWAAACGSSAPSNPDAGTADAAPSPDGQLDTFDGTIADESSAGIAGAKVCVLDHAEIPCATTDASGHYHLVAPDLQGQRIAVVATATDYLADVALETEPADQNGLHGTLWPSEMFLQTNAQALAQWGTQSGFTYPGEGTGFLLVRVNGATGGANVSATVSISPASGKGPVYWDANGPNPALAATTATGAVSFGDVAPGLHAITVTAPQKTCTVIVGAGLVAGDWAPSGAETTDVAIVADAQTLGVNVACL